MAYFAALRIGAATQVASIDRLSLVFVLLFATWFLDERYGWRGWLGIGLVVIGIALVGSDRTAMPTLDDQKDDVPASPA